MKRLLLLLTIILSASTVHAQLSSGRARSELSGTDVPTAACNPGPPWRDIYIRTTDNSEYQCTALNTWTQVIAGGTPGTVTTSGSPASPQLAKFSSATAITTATATDVSTPVQCADAGASDTYACNLAPAPASYVVGTHLRFFANTANTGAASINFNSLGALTIVKVAGGITTALATNDIRAGQWVDGVIAAGSNFQIQSTLGNAPSAGITNSAPANTIPLSDGTNLVDSNIEWDGIDSLDFQVGENGLVTISAAGLGAQIALRAAAGDATHVGGEVTINSGISDGNDGGDMTLTTGGDIGEGDSGSLILQTGQASNGEDGGGDSGDITLRVGLGATADSVGGSINLTAGGGRTGGGSVIINAGPRTVSGSHGTVQIYSADSNSSIDLSNTALTLLTPSLSVSSPLLSINATVTPAGTTTVQTIDKSAGSVNMATAESSKQVNNSTVTADSIILCTIATNDATAVIKNCVAGTGSFVITLNAAATAETRVNFWVITPQ